MAIVGSVLVLVAALIHVGIFVMESVRWSSPGVWRRFGMRNQQEADVVRAMAYSQGFYNLFLAGGAALGVLLHWTVLRSIGLGLMVFTATCMVLAAIVLLTAGRTYLRTALLQGVVPLLALAALAFS